MKKAKTFRLQHAALMSNYNTVKTIINIQQLHGMQILEDLFCC